MKMLMISLKISLERNLEICEKIDQFDLIITIIPWIVVCNLYFGHHSRNVDFYVFVVIIFMLTIKFCNFASVSFLKSKLYCCKNCIKCDDNS